ncbi:unnamed protein product [Closterium sp. Yama58-4]|nr:unnamed protein product [Closterium sp. Yama58-4]
MKRYFKPATKATAPQITSTAPERHVGTEAEKHGRMAERDGETAERDGGMTDGRSAAGKCAGEAGTAGGVKRPAEGPPAEYCRESFRGREEQLESREQGEQRQSTKADEPAQGETVALQEPLRIMSWNANSFLLRLRHDRAELLGFINKHSPDVIAIQEVRMPAAGRKGGPLNQSELKDDTKQAREERQFMQHALASPPFSLYRVWWSLAPTKYAGTAMLLKRSLLPHLLSASFSLDVRTAEQGKQRKHEADGRAIILEFPSIRLVNTYVPNNGFSKDSPSFPRRAEWDDRIRRFLTSDAVQSKPLIWLGDLNVSPTDDDVSDPEFFRTATNGEPATDPGDRGQPGFSPNERMRFAETLKRAGLSDAYRHMHPSKDMQAGFTWSGNPVGRYRGKRMRVDYFCVSNDLLPRVETCEIHGRGFEGNGFLGSERGADQGVQRVNVGLIKVFNGFGPKAPDLAYWVGIHGVPQQSFPPSPASPRLPTTSRVLPSPPPPPSSSRAQVNVGLIKVFNGFGPKAPDLAYWGYTGCLNNRSWIRYAEETQYAKPWMTNAWLAFVDGPDRPMIEKSLGCQFQSINSLEAKVSPRKDCYVVNLFQFSPFYNWSQCTDYTDRFGEGCSDLNTKWKSRGSPPYRFRNGHIGFSFGIPVLRHPISDNATSEEVLAALAGFLAPGIDAEALIKHTLYSVLDTGNSSAISFTMYDVTNASNPLMVVQPFPDDFIGRRYEGHCRYRHPPPVWGTLLAPMLLGLLVLLVAVLLTFIIVSLARKKARIRQQMAEVEEYTLALEQAERSKSEFVANLSHELRTPITGMLGMMDWLLESSLSEWQHRDLLDAKTCAVEAIGLLNSVLDLAKLQVGLRLRVSASVAARCACGNSVLDLAKLQVGGVGKRVGVWAARMCKVGL